MEFSKNELKKSTLKKVGEFGIFLDIILGEGTYSKVYLTSKLSQGVSITDTFFATKTIDKNEINPNKRELFEERVYKEIFILQNLDHPNIVKLIDVRSTTNNFYLIFEYCKGGTLDDYRKKKPSNKLLELEALEIIKQIADAMNFCVSKNPPIIHRDLKPANFLLQDGKIKISDFGFARLVENNEVKLKLTNKIGSALYMAPEIYTGEKYNFKCDVWSLGIVLYQLLYGETPWNSEKNQKDLFENNILKKPLEFNQDTEIKESTKELIRGMLELNQDKRINFVDVLNHPALKEKKKELKFGEASQLNSMKKSLGRNLELINEQPLVENCYINKKSMEIKEFETTIRYNEEEKNNDIAIDYDENREISKEKLKSNHKIIKSAENFVGFHLNIAKFLRKVFEDIRRNEIRLRNLKIQDATIIGYLLLLKKMELIILFPIKNMIQKGKTNDCLTSEFYNFPGDKKNLLNYLTENYNDSLKNFEDMLKETSELQEKNSYFELEFRLKKNKIFQIKYKEEFENLLQLLKNKTKQDKKEKNCFNKKIMRLLMEIIICKSFEDLFSFFTFDKDETNSDQFYELYEKLKNKDKVEKFIKRSFRN